VRALFFAMAACLVICNTALGTSVIAVRAPNILVLGADSKRITGDYYNSTRACKIGVSPNVFWAKAGISAVSTIDFNVYHIVSSVVNVEGNIVGE
jgi:hypothetical protein